MRFFKKSLFVNTPVPENANDPRKLDEIANSDDPVNMEEITKDDDPTNDPDEENTRDCL
jgi:hypothetical protein